MDFRPGTVFIYENFTFGDGSQVDKIFVVVALEAGRVLAFKTTSQARRNPPNPGCHFSSNVHRFADREAIFESGDGFHLPTWIQFDRAITFVVADLNPLVTKGKLRLIGYMSASALQSLVACAAQSEDLSQTTIDTMMESIRPTPMV